MNFNYASFIAFHDKRTALFSTYAQRDTTGKVSLKSGVTFPYADIGLTKALPNIELMINNLADYQLNETWYSGYTKYSKTARTLTFSMTVADAAKYVMSAKDIQVNNLDKEDQERIINKAHKICTAVGTGKFTAAQILIRDYQNPTSAVNDLTKAATEAAKTITTKEADCYKIALNLNNFVTDKRLKEIGRAHV